MSRELGGARMERSHRYVPDEIGSYYTRADWTTITPVAGEAISTSGYSFGTIIMAAQDNVSNTTLTFRGIFDGGAYGVKDSSGTTVSITNVNEGDIIEIPAAVMSCPAFVPVFSVNEATTRLSFYFKS